MNKSQRQNLILEQVLERPPQELLSTRALAQQFAVSETTIRRDFQALAAAGLIQRQYGGAQPNLAIAPDQKGQVGILLLSRIDKYSDPFYNMVLEGVDKALGRLGYHIAFVKTLFEVGTKAEMKRLLDSYDLQGIILRGTSYVESVTYLRGHFSPIVTVANHPELDDDLVLIDGEKGMRSLVEHLAMLGHRRLGYVAGYKDSRYSGFCQGLRLCQLDEEPALRQILQPGHSGWTPDLGARGAEILMSSQEKPDAIVCASDRLAIGAMAWLQRNGYRIPQDIAVAGFDNIPDSEFTFPPLTTVHVHKVLLGELAAERLVQRIEQPETVHIKIVTPTSLVVRQSCGASIGG